MDLDNKERVGNLMCSLLIRLCLFGLGHLMSGNWIADSKEDSVSLK